MPITPCVPSIWMITPFQASRPASVTTNDGTPRKATIEPCTAPITAPTSSAPPMAMYHGYSCDEPESCSSATTTAAEPAEVADREVDLADQEHEDDAHRHHRDLRHLRDQVVEVDRGEEHARLRREEDRDQHHADDHRQRADVAGLGASMRRRTAARTLSSISGSIAISTLGCRNLAHSTSAALAGAPEVMAPTISCWFVCAVS